MDVLVEAFSGNLSKEKAVAEVVSRFEAIETIRDGSVFHVIAKDRKWRFLVMSMPGTTRL